MNQSFLKGALLLSISMFATKLLGIVYLVPFKTLVGEEGMSLYGYAYTIYGLFISLSTLGIPVGLAKFTSKYHAKGEYDVARKVFKLGLIGMTLFGVVGYSAMYFLAPAYVETILAGEPELLKQAGDIVSMIRIVGTALLIIPAMALLRGFFQGNRTMTPTSISQFLEQLVRVLIILIGSYVVIHFMEGTYQQAVSISVFAAFLSGAVALLYLIYYWRKNRHQYDELLTQSVEHKPYKTSNLLVELIQCSIPFALLGLATNLFQNIDTWDFHRLLTQANMAFDLQKTYYGMYIMELAKIVMIPVSFSIAFSQPLVPELTRAFQLKEEESVKKTIGLALRLSLFITLPAIVGMSLLSKPLFISFYQSTPELNTLGGELFQTGCWLGLFFSLYSILSAILQGLNLQNKGILYLIIALVFKYVSNQFLVPLFGVNGFVYSTFVAYGAWMGLSLWQIKRVTNLSLRTLIKENIPSLIWSIIMGIAVICVLLGLNHWLPADSSSLQAILTLGVCGIIGMAVYFFGHYRSGTLQIFLSQLKKK